MQVRGEVTAGWVAAAAAMTVITLTTVTGNAIMLLAVRRAQKAPVHCALTSLLAADLLVGLCVLPLAAARELFVFHLPWSICACWSTLDVFCCTASILSLCALGWERWWGITAPLATSKRAKRVKGLVAVLWPASSVIAFPTGFIPSPRHYLVGEVPKACTVNTNTGYVFSSVSFSFYLPTSVMVFFYTMIIKSLATSPPIRAHRGKSPRARDGKNETDDTKLNPDENISSKSVTEESNKSPKEKSELKSKPNVMLQSPKRLHLGIPSALIPSPLRISSPQPKTSSLGFIIPRQRRATQIIVMLMSLFLLCWTPFFVMLPMDSLCSCVSDTAWQWCTWLGYANSALNPLVYAAASPSVRRALPSSLTNSRSNDVPILVINNNTPKKRRQEQ